MRASIVTSCLFAAIVLSSLARSQDLEPRAYANAPVGLNFLIGGYAHTEGGVVLDPTIRLENAHIEVHGGLLAYARSVGMFGRSAKFDIALPYADLGGSAEFRGTQYDRHIEGIGDPRLHFSINLYGAPALSMSDFKSYRQDLIVGASFAVSAPFGHYDSQRLINIGSNRWSFKPEIGLSQGIGRWIVEAAGAVTFYQDNDRFFGNHRRAQEPIYSVQGGVIRGFDSGIWFALFGTYYVGGRASIDGVSGRDLQENTRLGVILALPIDAKNSIKLYANTGVSTRTGTDFDAIGAAWQHRWGPKM